MKHTKWASRAVLCVVVDEATQIASMYIGLFEVELGRLMPDKTIVIPHTGETYASIDLWMDHIQRMMEVTH